MLCNKRETFERGRRLPPKKELQGKSLYSPGPYCRDLSLFEISFRQVASNLPRNSQMGQGFLVHMTLWCHDNTCEKECQPF